MRRLAMLTICALTALAGVHRSGALAQAAHGNTSAANLDRDIKKYQIDALLCGVQAIVAGIPGHGKLVEALRCAGNIGIDTTQAIRAAKSCSANGIRDVERMLACIKVGAEYFAASREAVACLANPLHVNKVLLENMAVFGSIVGCSLTVVKGVKLLANATAAANEARAEARESANALSRQISQPRFNRLFNLGYFRGCNQVANLQRIPNEERCVESCRNSARSWGDWGGNRADSNPGGSLAMSASQRHYYVYACTAGCKSGETRPNGWIATLIGFPDHVTRQGCKAYVAHARNAGNVKNVVFRVMRFPGTDQGSLAERHSKFLSTRIRLYAALNTLETHFARLPQAQPGVVRVSDIYAWSALQGPENEDLRLAALAFGSEFGTVTVNGRELPQFGSLLDSAGNGKVDGLVGTTDIQDLREELETYRGAPCEGNEPECRVFN